MKFFGASCRSRTNNLLITSQLLCHWANEAYYKIKMATQKGLEPSTSGVTGQHSNQLSYWAKFNGGNNRDRTCDPLLVRQMLSQLSYASKNLKMVTPRGIEPLLPPWKGGVLTAWPRGHKMELHVGVEPTTCWLQVSCSAIEPMKHIFMTLILN